ncbi:MAG: hypothetical protein M5U26_20790 [Planctomycetota bacterium]|nr:hypothetical protein [Planctomycetota bacterium]
MEFSRSGSMAWCWLVALAWTAGAPANEERVLADFNSGRGIFEGTAPVEGVPGMNGKAARIDSNLRLQSDRPGADWNSFTHLRLDVLNPGTQPARLHLCLKDDSAPHGYYSWINRYVSVTPGRHSVELAIAALKRGEGSPKDGLDPRPFRWEKLAFALLAGSAQPVYVASVRLVKERIATFAELRAYDFGPAVASIPFPGFAEVTPRRLTTPNADMAGCRPNRPGRASEPCLRMRWWATGSAPRTPNSAWTCPTEPTKAGFSWTTPASGSSTRTSPAADFA